MYFDVLGWVNITTLCTIVRLSEYVNKFHIFQGMLFLSGVNNNNKNTGKATGRDHNFDLYGLRNNQHGARMGVFKVSSGKGGPSADI